MSERLVVGNWKMGPTSLQDAKTLARGVAQIDRRDVTVGVAPPAPWLLGVAETLRGSRVLLFGQDAHWEEKGAFTGQV